MSAVGGSRGLTLPKDDTAQGGRTSAVEKTELPVVAGRLVSKTVRKVTGLALPGRGMYTTIERRY